MQMAEAEHARLGCLELLKEAARSYGEMATYKWKARTPCSCLCVRHAGGVLFLRLGDPATSSSRQTVGNALHITAGFMLCCSALMQGSTAAQELP
jgi:hypothetical protein